MDGKLADRCIDFLNEIYAIDPLAVKSLCEKRVSCNEHLANHPSVVVKMGDAGYTVGLVGLLNGLCGGGVAAIVEDDGTLKGFTRYKPK